MPYKLTTQQTTSNPLMYVLLFLLATWAMTTLLGHVEGFKLFFGSDKELICSKKCCTTEWPASVRIQDDRVPDADLGTKLLPSNINCNDGIKNTGCVCVPN